MRHLADNRDMFTHAECVSSILLLDNTRCDHISPVTFTFIFLSQFEKEILVRCDHIVWQVNSGFGSSKSDQALSAALLIPTTSHTNVNHGSGDDD